MIQHVAIIGAGLIGGSIALSARAAGFRVRLTDADAAVRERARALGIADEVPDELGDTVDGADLVIAAVPTSAVADVLAAAAPAAPAHAMLTDASSLKRDLTVQVEARLIEVGVEPGRFVGGHPMAGSEHQGPEAADASLFQAATWVLTPTATTADPVLHDVSAFVRALGARVLALSPARHDELVAVVSHLPQVVASALASVAADAIDNTGDAVLAVAAGGFRDTTRIAASDPELWTPILRGNRTAVLEALAAYRSRLGDLEAAIRDDDWAAVTAVLERASASRRRLVPKQRDPDVVDLVIPLEDQPGALAAATTALGELGVNVEDVAMRHTEDGTRGALLLRVAAAAASSAIEALHERHLAAHVEPVAPSAAEPTARP